jgi:secondary thiamine-phosphate synthase enzyme
VFCPHTTAAVTVNEDEEGLREDVEEKLDELIPPQDDYAHNEGHSPNAHAHMKAMLLGSSHTLPVREGELQLGTYQQVLLMENDGPQERTVQVWCLGE